MPPSIRFTGLEFEILWAAYDRDRLPYPLQYRTDIEDFDTLKHAREAAVDSVLQKYEPELERALQILVDPEARVEAKGFGGPELSQIYRFHGAVQGNAAAVVVQLPGPAPDCGGEVIIKYCSATQLGDYAVEALPKRKPGKHAPLEIRRDALESDRNIPIRRGPSLTEQLDEVFARPRQAYGEIMIFPGPALDARRSPGRSFWWMDYEDGRYYVKTTNPITARPIDPKSLAAEVNRLTKLTAQYFREDAAHDENLRTRHS